MSIVVPVDFSAVTDRVCEAAVEAALARQVPIWLIHVAEPEPHFVGYRAGPEVVRDQVAHEYREEHQKLQALGAQLRERGVEVHPLLLQGGIVEQILAQVEKHGANLIVMGSHGRGVMYQMLVGSISEGVIRKAHCPVLLVPAHD